MSRWYTPALHTMIWIIVLLTCHSTRLPGQFTVTGSVTDTEEQDNLPFARVSLHLPSSDLIYKGVLSDTNGVYVLNKIYWTDSMEIRCSQLGFTEISIRFLPPVSGDTLRVNFNLLQSAEELPEVSVSEQHVRFTIRGDTIAFNPKAYLLGNERTLGDLIRTIPELELTNNGEVRYQGKVVDAVLVEGLDVFNGRQRSATEDFDIEHVLSVEIIENHREMGDFLFGETNKVAFNVKLKQESKSRWVGRQEAGLASRPGGKGESGITNIRKGLNLKIAANSVGEAALSARDYMNAAGQIDPSAGGATGQFELNDLLPLGISLPVDLTRNEDYMLSAGFHNSLGENLTGKAGFIGALAHRRAGRNFERLTLDRPDERIIGTEASRQRPLFLLGTFSAEQRKQPKDSSARFSGNAGFTINESTLASSQNTSRQAIYDFRYQSRDVSSRGEVAWSSAVDRKVGHRISAEGTRRVRSKSISIFTPDGFRLLEAPAGLFELRQNFEETTSTGDLIVRSWRKVNKWTINHTGGLSADFLQYRAFANDLVLARGTGSARQVTVSSDANVRYQNGPYAVSLRNDFQKVTRKFLSSRRDNVLLHQSSLFLEVRKNAFNFVILRLFNDKDLANGLLAATGTDEIVDERTIISYNAERNALTRSTGANLSYFNRNLFKERLTVLFTAGYVKTRSGNLQISQPDEDLFRLRYITLDNAHSTTGALRLILPLTKWLQIITNSQFVRTAQTTFSATERQLAFTITTKNHSINLKVLKWKRVKVSITAGGRSTLQSLEGQVFRTSDSNYGLNFNYEHERNRFSVNLSRRNTRVREISLYNTFMSGSYSYRLRKKWEVFLRGENLTQLVPETLNGGAVSTNSITSFSYRTFPGYLMIGLERFF